MKRHTAIVIFALILVGNVQAFAQSSSRSRIDPKLTTKLREDVATALTNANLSEEQQRVLRDAGETLRAAGEARQSGKSVDRDEVKKAFDDLKTVVESDALRPEDAKRIKEDMEAIRKAMRDQMKGRFPRRRPEVAVWAVAGAFDVSVALVSFV